MTENPDRLEELASRYLREGTLSSRQKHEAASLLSNVPALDAVSPKVRAFATAEAEFLYGALDDAQWCRLFDSIPGVLPDALAADEPAALARIEAGVFGRLKQATAPARRTAPREQPVRPLLHPRRPAGWFERGLAALWRWHAEAPVVFALGVLAAIWVAGPSPRPEGAGTVEPARPDRVLVQGGGSLFGTKGGTTPAPASVSLQAPPGAPLVAIRPDRGDGASYRIGERVVLEVLAEPGARLALIDVGSSGRLAVAATLEATSGGRLLFPPGGFAVSGPAGFEQVFLVAALGPAATRVESVAAAAVEGAGQGARTADTTSPTQVPGLPTQLAGQRLLTAITEAARREGVTVSVASCGLFVE